MKRWIAVKVGAALMLLCLIVTSPPGGAADISHDQTVRYILAAVEAFRSTYVRFVVERVTKAGIHTDEEWTKDDHAIMLPFQFVEQGGAQIKHDFPDVDVGLISLTPINPSNLPKTSAEREALMTLVAESKGMLRVAESKPTVLTFGDGHQYKGLTADMAIDQLCADCHNHHPKSPKKDFKQGDVMGAIIVRIKQ